MTLHMLIGRGVLDSEGVVFGEVVDVLFIPAAPGACLAAPHSEGGLAFAEGGYLALVVVEVADGADRQRLMLQATELAFDPCSAAIIAGDLAGDPRRPAS